MNPTWGGGVAVYLDRKPPGRSIADDMFELIFRGLPPSAFHGGRGGTTPAFGGWFLTVTEIARAFVISESGDSARIVRAQLTVSKPRVPLKCLVGGAGSALASVLEVNFI